jgi:DNA-binding Lrp family transcriptional regulator
MSAVLDDADRRLVKATAAGLPLVPRPYETIGAEIGMESAEVRRRLQALLDRGVIRRIGAVPNHYALGYRANGMSVWDVPDEKIAEIGARVGALDFVTHCYERPRRLPDWPFNLFAMVHGRARDEVEEKVAAIASLIGVDCRGHRVLYSSRILKKSGYRPQE